MALKSAAKFEEKLPLGSKNDMRNLINFHPTTQKYKISLERAIFVQSI